jgi:glycosyltransferase involved in cell wall biosynthesis
MPLVTVVIPAYNRQQSLPRAIESVLNQTFGDLEIVVVDDGSTDSTAAIAEEFALRDFRVKLICHEKNRGAQAARNTGARSAKGEWLNFFDSDDWMLPTSIEARLTAARIQNMKIVHSGAFVQYENKDRALFGVPPLRGWIYETLLRAPGPLFQGMIIAIDAFRRMGELDEHVIAWQEWDTAIRLARNHAFGFVSEPTFVYDCTGSDTISKNLLKAAIGYEYIVNKHLAEMFRRLGPKAVSQHYKAIATHYAQAGDSNQATKSKLKSFLWWPNPKRALRKLVTSVV